MLNQIEHCWSYADLHNRYLLVDTLKSGFRDDLDRYFIPLDDQRITFGSFNPLRWPGDCYPRELTGRINDYVAQYMPPPIGNFVEEGTTACLTFDSSIHYPEQILLHEQCGGGRRSLEALRRMRLRPEIAKKAFAKIKKFGKYSAFHVRNTDRKTEYLPFFENVAQQASGELLVLCTDDWHCQIAARNFFGDQVQMSSNIPNTHGQKLHNNKHLDPYSTNLDAITDLIVLAMAKQLFITHHTTGAFSGYSKLARMLHRQQDVVRNLLGRKA